MNMETIKKYKISFVLVLVIVAGAFFFFNRMYQNDMKALNDFSASYEKFDKAISDFSANPTDDSKKKADDALAELTAKANFRISSLIKHDPELMSTAREVADLSGRELEGLIAYKEAIQNKNADPDTLAKEYADLITERKAARARFQSFAE